MTIPEILEKIKKGLNGIDKRNVLIACLAVAVAVLGWLSWHSPEPVDVQGLLAKLEAKLTEKHKAEMKAREDQIKDLSNRLTVSTGKYQALYKKLQEVKNEPPKEPPKTNKELRDRFTALGFAPR